MKTVLTLDTLIYQLIYNSTIRSYITGSIYKRSKVQVFAKSCQEGITNIVVGTIAVSPDDITQRATCNVNIYVPDKLTRVGGVDQYVVDCTKLESLSNIVIALFPKTGTDYVAWVGNSPGKIFKEAGFDLHCANIRIEFLFTNTI